MINSIDLINKIPSLNTNYTSAESKQKTVAILGSSSSTESLEKYLKISSDITRHFIENGFNVVHGCGSHGIMGRVYNAAKDASIKDSNGKPLQNLAIIVEPLWGDENLHDCIAIGKAKSDLSDLEQKVLKQYEVFLEAIEDLDL